MQADAPHGALPRRPRPSPDASAQPAPSTGQSRTCRPPRHPCPRSHAHEPAQRLAPSVGGQEEPGESDVEGGSGQAVPAAMDKLPESAAANRNAGDRRLRRQADGSDQGSGPPRRMVDCDSPPRRLAGPESPDAPPPGGAGKHCAAHAAGAAEARTGRNAAAAVAAGGGGGAQASTAGGNVPRQSLELPPQPGGWCGGGSAGGRTHVMPPLPPASDLNVPHMHAVREAAASCASIASAGAGLGLEVCGLRLAGTAGSTENCPQEETAPSLHCGPGALPAADARDGAAADGAGCCASLEAEDAESSRMAPPGGSACPCSPCCVRCAYRVLGQACGPGALGRVRSLGAVCLSRRGSPVSKRA